MGNNPARCDTTSSAGRLPSESMAEIIGIDIWGLSFEMAGTCEVRNRLGGLRGSWSWPKVYLQSSLSSSIQVRSDKLTPLR